MADGKVVGLDIGTSMIRVAIGELDPDTGNIRIAGEVRIYLQRVRKERKEVFETRKKQGVVEDTVDEVHRQVIGHNNLLRQTVEDPEDRDTEGSAA